MQSKPSALPRAHGAAQLRTLRQHGTAQMPSVQRPQHVACTNAATRRVGASAAAAVGTRLQHACEHVIGFRGMSGTAAVSVRRGPSRERVQNAHAGGATSLAEWQREAQRTGSHIGRLNRVMAQLQHVRGRDVAANVPAALHEVLQLLHRNIAAGDARLASFLDAMGSAVQAHPLLAVALRDDAAAPASVAQALDHAAAQEATYTNDKCTAQMATAQAKLQLYCEPFWQGLVRNSLQHAGPRAVATVVHRWGVLAGEQGAPAPVQGLWNVLEASIASTALTMEAQAVCNCWRAFAKVARKPHHAAYQALSQALLRTRHSVVPQDVSNTLWAFAKLERAAHGGEHDVLLSAALRTASRMRAQEVANTWWAIAKLKWPVHGQLCANLLAAVQRSSKGMVPQEVSNVRYALALLGERPRGAPRGALVGAAVRVSVGMEPQHVANTLWALAKLGLALSNELQAALLAATVRISTIADPQDVASALWALAKLSVPVSTELQTALFAAITRVSEQMNGQDAANAVWALGELGMQPGSQVRRALCDALVRNARAAPLEPEGVRMAQRGLLKLQWPVSAELERALARTAARAASGCCQEHLRGPRASWRGVKRARQPPTATHGATSGPASQRTRLAAAACPPDCCVHRFDVVLAGVRCSRMHGGHHSCCTSGTENTVPALILKTLGCTAQNLHKRCPCRT
jgi:hypothetical protein